MNKIWKNILLMLFGTLALVITIFYINHEAKEDDLLGGFYNEEKSSRDSMVLDVLVENDVIKHIEILKHNETPGFDKAMVQIADDIISQNSLNVDTVSGATITSTNFILAVKETLEKNGHPINSLKSMTDDESKKANISDVENTDILIVGGGGAGFTAAIEALSLEKLNVTVLEKMSFGGGNTRMSGGEYAAAGNWVQQAEGISGDSTEQFFKDIYEGGERRGNPKLIEIIANNSLSNAQWLRDYVGVKFKGNQSYYGGHTYKRTLWPEGDGAMYVDTLISKAESLGADVKYNTKATELIVDDSGRVVGVKAISGGKAVEYRANRGVILTTGGFSANVEMRKEYDRQWANLNESIPTTNSPAITGDGIIMASDIGANLIDMEYIQLYPVNNPATGNYYFMDYARLNSNALLLNQEGKRFVDEKNTRQNLSQAMLNQTGAKAYELIDSRVVKEMKLETLYGSEMAKCYEQGVLFKGSLEECSEFFKIPSGEVKNSVERYNGFAKNNLDLDFNRTERLEEIGEGPYYMFSCVVSVHHTMGGVEIDESARVIDTEGNVIPGLYAAGEVTGGIHGANRLGSMSIPDTVAFGRIAARSAVSGK